MSKQTSYILMKTHIAQASSTIFFGGEEGVFLVCL